MGRRAKRAALASALLLLGMISGGGYFGRLADASTAQGKLTGKKQPASAKVLYADNCARCHGADGRGQTAMGRAFAAPNLADAGWWKKERPSDKRLTASIRDGRNQNRMPTFGHQLSKSEITALVRLVRTFGGK
ncbi:MAG: c-type cytochrome [Acidobacteria bacterium]|nr:c-type cytochrome [Acidobacteriota bacterium]